MTFKTSCVMPPFTTKIKKNMCTSMEDLPDAVMVDILSRLPVKTIIHCKFVCKKWLGLVSDSYFANRHLLRSPAGLMMHHRSEKEETLSIYHNPGILKWVEVEDEPNHHKLHHDPVMSLDLNLAPIFQKSRLLLVGAVDGLICLWQFGPNPERDNTYICNPITREYMILPPHQHQYHDQYHEQGPATANYCFGVSPITQEYKVIRVFHKTLTSDEPNLTEAEVYTLGTGHWRSLGHVPFPYWLGGHYGPFLNGHAHWNVYDKYSPEKICAFDFDEETFELFPSPPNEAIRESHINHKGLGVLKGCLCRCDTYDWEFEIWVMKEYGIRSSWHKAVVIKDRIPNDFDSLTVLMMEHVDLIEGLKDGTILMFAGEYRLLAYCLRRKTILDTQIFDSYLSGWAYRPSFLKLQDFENETVHVL